ncbi:MAG: DUF3990 domain-containing protein [Kiritimatiellae bacterium]|nr:DUF3990 domain-containing protein [Kiritimatiellia bacterium]
MIVYHGSTVEIKSPDLNHAKRFLDFGPAFYVTSFREQAEHWARRKCSRVPSSSAPVVNVYELDDDLSAFSVLRFCGVDETWLDFVCDCRDGKDVYSAHDAIIGRVADDDVFRTIQSYRQGDITKARAIELLRFARPNDQFALRTSRIISAKLRFVRSYEMESVA